MFRVLALLIMVLANSAHAEVVRVEITRTTDLLGGRGFGGAGAYELIEGRAHFALDPAHKSNAIITDIALAPRNTRGLVEFSADIAIMRPKVAARASGVVLFDVGNHGERTVFEYLNRGDRRAARASAQSIGDDFLMERGVTLVWLGWQQDLPESRADKPLSRLMGPVLEGVTGWVRGEFTVATRVNDVSLGAGDALPYPVLDRQADDSALAIRGARTQPPKAIPGEAWAFARMQDGKRTGDNTRLSVQDGFVPGALYQFAYRAEKPRIAGLGLAAVRDLMSWVRHDPAALVKARLTHAFGAGQGGRFLRQFVHDGFNADIAGRRVFDAMMIHGAGASRLGFNERFAQPSRAFETSVFPFSDEPQSDDNVTTGLLDRARAANSVPRIFYTTTSWDYWGEAASLTHSTLATPTDAPLPGTTRIYHFAGTAASPARVPFVMTPETRSQLPYNPVDYRYGLRALYALLERWVLKGALPPPSRYPKVSGNELVPYSDFFGTPLFGVSVPPGLRPLYRRTPQGDASAPAQDKPYTLLAPQVDVDGNELAGIRLPMIAAPLAAYTGWNLRAPGMGAPREMIDGMGAMIPFPRTRDERTVDDTRGVILERYASRAGYLKRIAIEAELLSDQGLLLWEDNDHLIRDAGVLWDYVMQGNARPPPAVEP